MRPQLLTTAAVAAISLAALAIGACSGNSSTGSGGSGGSQSTTGTGQNGTGTGTGGSQSTGATMSTGSSGACVPDCAPGSICQAGSCVPGCDPGHPCDSGKTCCNDQCVDTKTDPKFCGACDGACAMPAHIQVGCNGTCTYGSCDAGFFNCDGNNDNGCESSAPCACTPGSMQACYTAAMSTNGVGVCHGGMQTCNASGTDWGPCTGEVVPSPEICANGLDEDCDGTPDNVPDLDGDGWTVCDGDCCDVAGGACGSPALVNPGAFEVAGNMVDDDCDGTVDNALGACSTTQKFSGLTPQDVTDAIDLCQATTANPPLPMKKWGVLSSSFLFANGATPTAAQLSTLASSQVAVLQNYGTGGIAPKFGATMAGLSTGLMRDKNDPGFVPLITGSSFANAINFSPNPGGPLGTYLAAHAGALLSGHCGATTCTTGTNANDSLNVRVQLRVPTNAQAMHYDFRFFSAEYQTFQCTAFNDYYLAMLTTGAMGIPADHNISFDAMNNPVSVNNGFFQDCGGNGKNCGNCPNGTGALAGTGLDDVAGGGTEWLTTDAPVVPGETLTIEFVLFDVGDHIYDSITLLDNFRWDVTPATVGTHQ